VRKFFALFSACIIATFSLNGISPASAKDLNLNGPGGRIHGADISRWQHPDGKPINFVKMHDAGVSFVMIKASDSRDDADQLAAKYVKMDRTGAQAAGIYTGFYHYAILPDVTAPSAIIKDAQVQAQKVVWRIASLGGYNEMDLPVALDIENNCVRLSSTKVCKKSATRSAATLWSKTFLKTIKEKTGRTPLIYSSPYFLENSLIRDKELSSYPLWIAQYAIDPAKEGALPNFKLGAHVKAAGCYVHSWTTSGCTANWTVWQYTSCGIAPKYGVPGNRLDLNVFGGGAEKFQSLLTGTWMPDTADFMPQGETSTITITSVSASTTNKNAVISVEVKRPDNSPVVTGAVKYYFHSSNSVIPKVTQTIARETSGSWKLSIAGLPAGTWVGNVGFKDASGTHAEVKAPLTLSIEQGPTPPPAPTKKPSVKPPTDSCRNQIKN
jgi:GH25 family lysozyme M1 (1,4-beta-N-acetylmuramidase)